MGQHLVDLWMRDYSAFDDTPDDLWKGWRCQYRGLSKQEALDVLASTHDYDVVVVKTDQPIVVFHEDGKPVMGNSVIMKIRCFSRTIERPDGFNEGPADLANLFRELPKEPGSDGR